GRNARLGNPKIPDCGRTAIAEYIERHTRRPHRITADISQGQNYRSFLDIYVPVWLALGRVASDNTRALISAIRRFSAVWRGSGRMAARASAMAPARSDSGSTPSKVGFTSPSMIACQSARP